MKSVGAILLFLGGLLALPTLLDLVHPLWWHDWFNQPAAPLTPWDVANHIATVMRWTTLSGYAAVVVLLLGFVFLMFGFCSSSPPEDGA